MSKTRQDYCKLSSADMASAIGGASVQGLSIPTGELRGALIRELQNRRTQAAKVTAEYPTRVGARASLAVLLSEIHHGAA